MFTITRPSVDSTRAFRDLMSFIGDDAVFSDPTAELALQAALPLDISENEGHIVVRASLPGFTREEIDISVHNGVLSIKAERRESEESKNEKYFRRERRVQTLTRQVQLPGHVSERQADAELKDGVLTLRIPHSEEARPKRIQIK